MNKKRYLSFIISIAMLGGTVLWATSNFRDFIFDFAQLQTGTFANSHQFVVFSDQGNDFIGTFFFDNAKTLATGEIVTIYGGVSKECFSQIRGIYYNNQRGLRNRPLDNDTANNMKLSGTAYSDLYFTGGLFFNCSGDNKKNVYGQVTHTYSGNNYYIVAGMNLTGGGYSPNFSGSFIYDWTGKQALGSFWDTWGGRAKFVEKQYFFTYTGSSWNVGEVSSGSSYQIPVGTTIQIVSDPSQNLGTGSVLLSGIQSIKASGSNWNGLFSAPSFLTGNEYYGALTHLISGQNLSGIYHTYPIFKVGALDGASLYASGGYFQISLHIDSGNANQIIRILRSENSSGWSVNTPDSTCTLNSQKMCNFRTNHLSFFGLFSTSDGQRTTIGENVVCSDQDGCICSAASSNISNGTTCLASLVSTGASYGRGARFIIDNCSYNIRSRYNLPGANEEGIDYSPSYYDKDCRDSRNPKKKIDDIIIEKGRIANSIYSKELNNAYLYAYSVGSTTMPTIQQANMTGELIRKHLAKMISEYAVSIVGLQPDLDKKGCDKYSDIVGESPEMKFYIKLSCQLGLMGLESDGKSAQKTFRPNEVVTRAQFGTILSRVLYGEEYNGGTLYYDKHLKKLNNEGIITKISKPNSPELRGWIMLMLMRADQTEVGTYYSRLYY